MAASVANSRKALTSGANTTTCASFTSTTGDTIYVTVSDASGQGGLTIADNKGNTYTQVGTTQTSSLGGSQLRRYACQNATGGSGHTVTATWAANSDAVVCVFDITGVVAASLDKSAQADDSSSPWTVTSATLTQADEIAISAVSGSWNGTFSESSGFTINQQEGNNALYWTSAAGSKVVSATTALTPSWTISGGGSGSAVTIDTFKAAAAGGNYAGTPGQAAIALSGPAVTLARTANVALTPGQAVLTLSGPAPTLAQTSGTTLTPGVAALTLSGPAPTLVRTANQSFTPGAAAITLTGPVPTVSQASGLNLIPPTAAITVATFAPTLARTANVGLSPAPGVIALAGPAPSFVQTGGSVPYPLGSGGGPLQYFPSQASIYAQALRERNLQWIKEEQAKTRRLEKKKRKKAKAPPPDIAPPNVEWVKETVETQKPHPIEDEIRAAVKAEQDRIRKKRKQEEAVLRALSIFWN